jgi:hypothetical protein
MARFHLLYTRGVWSLFAFTAGAAAGVRWPARPLRWEVRAAESSAAANAAWMRLFAGAQREIWLSAGRLESAALLGALDAAAARGVEVHVTLSPEQNPDPNRGTRAWLRLKTRVRDTRIAPRGFTGACCAVDRTDCVVTAQDLLSGGAAAGPFLCAADADLAGRLASRLQADHAAAAEEPPP